CAIGCWAPCFDASARPRAMSTAGAPNSSTATGACTRSSCWRPSPRGSASGGSCLPEEDLEQGDQKDGVGEAGDDRVAVGVEIGACAPGLGATEHAEAVEL